MFVVPFLLFFSGVQAGLRSSLLKFELTAAGNLFLRAMFFFQKSKHCARRCKMPKFAKRYACIYVLQRQLHVISHRQTPQSCDLVYYKLVEWMQASALNPPYSNHAASFCL